MCFRPAGAGQSLECPQCGKTINAIMGNWPLNCPFCNLDITSITAELDEGAAEGSPTAPTPGAPKAPSAPAAPAAPKPPTGA